MKNANFKKRSIQIGVIVMIYILWRVIVLKLLGSEPETCFDLQIIGQGTRTLAIFPWNSWINIIPNSLGIILSTIGICFISKFLLNEEYGSPIIHFIFISVLTTYLGLIPGIFYGIFIGIWNGIIDKNAYKFYSFYLGFIAGIFSVSSAGFGFSLISGFIIGLITTAITFVLVQPFILVGSVLLKISGTKKVDEPAENVLDEEIIEDQSHDTHTKKKINEMKVGETGFITPWAFAFDLKKEIFLNLNSNSSDIPFGLFRVPIERINEESNGFKIDIQYFKAWISIRLGDEYWNFVRHPNPAAKPGYVQIKL